MAERPACSVALRQLSELGNDPARIISWRGQQALTAGALLDLASGWAQLVRDLPLGQPVAVHFQDTFAAAGALLGAWYAGRTVILAADTQSETVRRLQQDLGAWLLGEFDGAPLSPPPAPRLCTPELKPEQAAVVVFTSGSTGAPLALHKTLGQLLDEVCVQQTLWGAALAGTTIVATVSHQHIYGLLFRLLLPLVAGVPFVAERLEYPEEVQGVLQQRPSSLVSSPAFLKRLPAGAAWAAAPAIVFSSGGPLTAEAARRAEERLQAPVMEIYGSSETGGIAWRQQSRGALWHPLPHVDIALTDGLLKARSPWTQQQDWHQTSDRARLQADGFALEGRADRLVKLEEKRVSLDAIEACLALCPEVEEARVVVLPGERLRLGAVVVLTDAGRARLAGEGKRPLNEHLRRELLQEVERVALPRYWRYVDALPVNPLGKTAQAALLALFDAPAHRYPPVLGRTADAAGVVLELLADANLTWFDGHFPGLPILPGVAMLDWAEHFGRAEFALPPDLLRMDVIKFQKVILPGTQVRLELEWLPQRSALAFRATSALGPHASGRLIFGGAHDD